MGQVSQVIIMDPRNRSKGEISPPTAPCGDVINDVERQVSQVSQVIIIDPRDRSKEEIPPPTAPCRDVMDVELKNLASYFLATFFRGLA